MFKNLFNKKQKTQKTEDYFDNDPENKEFESETNSIENKLEDEIDNNSIVENIDLTIDPELLSLNSKSSMIPNYDDDKVSILSESTYHSSSDFSQKLNHEEETYIQTIDLLLNCYDY